MARMARIKADWDMTYHVMSRITGKMYLLRQDDIKADMYDALKRAAMYSGVEVDSFAIMDDHFHIVLKVVKPEEGTVTESEVLRRIALLKGSDAAEAAKARWRRYRSSGHAWQAEAEFNSHLVRMHDLSQFVKTFKETFGMRFRRRTRYVGTIWGGRFKSTLVDTGFYFERCVDYVEHNPVRAGLSEDPESYAWCTMGMARNGDAFAQDCILRRSLKFLRQDTSNLFATSIPASTGDSPQSPAPAIDRLLAPAASGDSPQSGRPDMVEGARSAYELWRKVCPQITEGVVFGSIEFVKGMIAKFAGACISRRVKPHEVTTGIYSSHGHRKSSALCSDATA